MGLSPRVRGNLDLAPGAVAPASMAVYPRACGGTAPTRTLTLPIAGLSPRVRGNPLMSLNVWFVSRRDSFRGYVKDCFRRAVMRRLHVPDRDG